VFTFATLCLSAAAQNIQRKKGQHKAGKEEEPNHNKQTSDDKLFFAICGWHFVLVNTFYFLRRLQKYYSYGKA